MATSLACPAESLEDPLGILRVDPDAGVAHPDPQLTQVINARADADLVLRSGVPHGVVRQLEQGLGEPLRVGDDAEPGAPVGPPTAWPQSGGLVTDLVNQSVEVDRSGPEEVGAAGLGQHDQVVDQAAHPVQLIQDQGADVGHLVGIGGVEHFEVALDDRQWGAQFVARVIEEMLLGLEGGLESVEHRVDRSGQLADVVVPADRDPQGQVAVRDVLGGGAQQSQRSQQPPCHEPADQPDHRQAETADQGVGAGVRQGLLLTGSDRVTDHVSSDAGVAVHQRRNHGYPHRSC